jgi:hypothetical protein
MGDRRERGCREGSGRCGRLIISKYTLHTSMLRVVVESKGLVVSVWGE